MSESNKELWLFTMRFPFGTGEPFLENELPILCERFERVRIFPMFKADGVRTLPANATTELLINDPYDHAGVLSLLRNWSIWSHVTRAIKASAPSAAILKGQWPEIRSTLRQAISRAALLKERMKKGYDPQRVVLYSYWTYDWATVLGILKIKDSRINFVTRMLGFDMFKFRSRDGWPAFRTFHLQQVSNVHIISQAGLDHMVEHYPEFRDKYNLSLLATNDHGRGDRAPSEILRVVSCSNLVELKRVDIIVKALGLLKGLVKWTHFGDGPERERIDELISKLPDNISVDLQGNRPNESIIKWYQENSVDVFVHVSSTEGGVPVAIQEAASFGIPLIGADSGGVPEIVNEHTGELLPHDLTPELLADRLQGFRNSKWYYDDARDTCRGFWSDNFRADVIYGKFADALKNS